MLMGGINLGVDVILARVESSLQTVVLLLIF